MRRLLSLCLSSSWRTHFFWTLNQYIHPVMILIIPQPLVIIRHNHSIVFYQYIQGTFIMHNHHGGEASPHYCQAQPKLQVKLSLKAELTLISISSATHTPGKFIFQHFSVNVDQVCSQELEDNLNFKVNGRQPQV